jgi:hypothetical protein
MTPTWTPPASARPREERKRIIAAAIANARGMRRGVPPIINVLDILPPKLRDEVLDDAENVLLALGEP